MSQKRERGKIKNYQDLLVWQKGHSLVKKILQACRKLRKNTETQVITRQLIKAATSIPANIAEGYGSHQGKGFASYLRIARGSVTETDYWLYLLHDEEFITSDDYKKMKGSCQELIVMLSSLIDKVS